MSSSNETFRKFRKFSWYAGGLTALCIAALFILFYQVNGLSEHYGQIERDIHFYSSKRDQLQQERDSLRQQIATLQADLTAVNDEVRRGRQSRDEVVASEAVVSAARDDAKADLAALEERERAALDVIANAEHDSNRISKLTTQKEELAQAVDALTREQSNLEQSTSVLRTQNLALKNELTSLLGRRDSASTEVQRLEVNKEKFTALTARVEELSIQESELSKKIADIRAKEQAATSAAESAALRLEQLQVQITTETTARDTLAREREQAQGELATLTTQIDALRLQETDLKGEVEIGRTVLVQAAQAKNELATLTGQRDALVAEVNEKQIAKGALDTQIASASVELQQAQERMANLAAQAGVAEASESEATTRLASIEKNIQQSEARAATARTALTTEMEALADAIAKREQLTNELELLKLEIDRLRALSRGLDVPPSSAAEVKTKDNSQATGNAKKENEASPQGSTP